ncbi:hypothetical protein PMAYCL1PPCAC_10417, partial [Pristionchus mayeri]
TKRSTVYLDPFVHEEADERENIRRVHFLLLQQRHRIVGDVHQGSESMKDVGRVYYHESRDGPRFGRRQERVVNEVFADIEAVTTHVLEPLIIGIVESDVDVLVRLISSSLSIIDLLSGNNIVSEIFWIVVELGRHIAGVWLRRIVQITRGVGLIVLAALARHSA